MAVPTDRRYTESHEWCKKESEGEVRVGISQFAADQLTDITFVELPKVGAKITAGQPFGEIESVKSAGDLYAPVSGEVLEINPVLKDDPGLVNREPYEGAWMIRVRPSKPEQMDDLLDASAYEARIAEEA